MTMTRWITPFVFWSLMLPAAGAQDAASPSSQEEIVENVLELQRQIEELLAALPPAMRAELRRRLAEPPEVPATASEPTEPIMAQPPPEATAQSPVEPTAPASVEPSVAQPTPIAAEPTMAAVEAPSTTTTPSATTPAPAVEPTPGDGIPKLIKRRSKRAPCNTLLPLDENGDGKISSADRYWRYIYIWTDKNGDQQLQDREVQSAYDLKIREITVSLETFIRNKGSLGEMRVEDQIVLDLRGDGFSDRSRRDDGILVIDASALGRGEGPRLLDSGPEGLSGFVAFRSGLRLEVAGEVTELNCP